MNQLYFYIVTAGFALCAIFPTTIVAASGCNESQYESENGTCYPAWHGRSESGAYYTIVIPTKWSPKNGLVIWNHGFQSFLTDFESSDLLSILDPNWEGYFTGQVKEKPSLGPYAETILKNGFAMAASSYSQTGWAVFDSHVTNGDLYNQFVSIASSLGQSKPQQFYIIGGSLGGIVTLRDIESDNVPNPDGALILCGAVAGSNNWLDAFDLRMIYESVCNTVSGAELPKPWHKRPDLLFGELEYLDSLNQCVGIQSRLLINENNPLEVFAWEQFNPEKNNRLKEILETSRTVNPYFLALNLWYAVFQIPRLINDGTQLNGENPFTNVGINYGNAFINQSMQRIISLPSSLQKLLTNYSPTGNIGATKIISIHTSHDGLVPVQNQRTLQNLIPKNQLTVGVVDDSKKPSHCGFSVEEGLVAWAELTEWVNGAIQPTAFDLQSSCLLTAADRDSCNYNPTLTIETSIPTFKRKERLGVTGINTYDAESGQLRFQSLQLMNSQIDYNGSLVPTSHNSLSFIVENIQSTKSNSFWQHSAKYDADSYLLYIPSVNIINLTPPDDHEYDVYFRLVNETGGEILQFLEISSGI